ncbi:MAG: SAM-dependent methyltransferase [Bacteroidaceae bacterium]|nr:SAM-dependent methyltransferase [Bacteroidaceae bacterium]
MQISAETIRFIEEHAKADVRSLALQAKKYPEVDMAVAVVQIAGRQIAEAKVPSWHRVEGLLYPKHLSMEQCSSEATALYKAGLVEGETFADLTGGFGIDCSFLSRKFKQANYVERQAELCELAGHNFPLLGLNIGVHNEDGVDYLKRMQPVDCLYLDPARRDGHGGKTVAISDCEPDVSALEELLVEKAKTVMVKLSPMLDLSLALKSLKHVQEVHIVSVNNECKELLLLLRKDAVSSEIQIHCEQIVNSCEHQHYAFTLSEEHTSECPLAEAVGAYLYEPNASILKAGAYRSLTQAYSVEKLHASSHLYTSAHFIEDFPGRRFKVEAVSGFGKKELKEFMQGMEKANLTIRNFPSSVAELRKRLKLKEGGEDYLFATTLADESKVLIKCRKTVV